MDFEKGYAMIARSRIERFSNERLKTKPKEITEPITVGPKNTLQPTTNTSNSRVGLACQSECKESKSSWREVRENEND